MTTAMDGDGWSGVTDEQKRGAGARLPDGSSPGARVIAAVSNANHVADMYGSGHWTKPVRPEFLDH